MHLMSCYVMLSTPPHTECTTVLNFYQLRLFKDLKKKCVACPTWCFEGSRGTFRPGWCDAHLGRHAPPPRTRLGHLGHLGHRSSLLTGLLILALGLRGWGGWGRLPARGAAAGVHACFQLFLNLLQVLSSGPAAAHLPLCMLGPASFLGLEDGGCQRKHIKISLHCSVKQ